jgi:hypothetical protein
MLLSQFLSAPDRSTYRSSSSSCPPIFSMELSTSWASAALAISSYRQPPTLPWGSRRLGSRREQALEAVNLEVLRAGWRAARRQAPGSGGLACERPAATPVEERGAGARRRWGRRVLLHYLLSPSCSASTAATCCNRHVTPKTSRRSGPSTEAWREKAPVRSGGGPTAAGRGAPGHRRFAADGWRARGTPMFKAPEEARGDEQGDPHQDFDLTARRTTRRCLASAE